MERDRVTGDEVRAAVAEVFGNKALAFGRADGSWDVEITHKDLTFAEVFALSQRLGTNLIDFETDVDGTGCDTCGYGASATISIRVRWPAPGPLDFPGRLIDNRD